MLKEDYELTREDIQLLSSRDALAAFFAKSGYDTNARLVQNVAAMGITSDSLKPIITHIERLASQDARRFEVYLFELKSVTVAATQGIVRTFRNRPGDYLLVLTDDYQRLDFVLVERFSPEPIKSQEIFSMLPTTPKQVGVRPRILTVNRRNPDQVALRVLRRFSYTEADTFAQYDKLLSAYSVADWSEPFFNNRALFSDYYLTERLPQGPEWHNPGQAASMTQAFKQLRELYADVRETFSNQPAEVVRARLLEPVLTALGFVAQPVKTSKSEVVQPDYRLYAANNAGQPSATPLALCLAYTWGRSLDGKDEQRDSQAPDENPGAAVVTLLDRAEADWAIVTNGKIWRLYAAKAHSRATNYYEIDLEETLALPAAHLEHAFRYFWLLFRAAAFIATEDAQKRQMCFLDSLLSESERYAKGLGERLKERVFDKIFPHFARGFIIHARATGLIDVNLDSLDAEQRNRLLEPYFSGTLTFLYRLLFLLYAESRDLLPVREVRGYYEQSLEKLKRQIAEKVGAIEDEAPAKIKAAYNDISTAFYDRLQELFRAVDQGDAALNVPVYNGGLFATQPDPADTSPEAEVARFLATHKIPDRELALGLDLMARDMDEKRHDLVSIDYKSLGVRQLGSIYEGLLEFKLRIAPEEMAVVRGKKTEEIVPYAEAQQKKLPILKEGRSKYERTLPKGRVYLENDRRERKATGSYYTPDYIVKYIIENTVGPVLHEKLEALRPTLREAEKTLRAERAKSEALKKQGLKGDTPENETYKKHRAAIIEVFFDLKVLDPAMGSGHFLVEVVDYITDRMADFLTAFKWNPIIHELARTRQEIQDEMERQGVTVDVNKLTDLNLLKRQVLKRCIYGVDLNPMAVELAKVSLWLDCFTLGAPLSFLDHHMKAGNSLIGGSVQEVQDALSQDLFGHQFAGLLNATQLMRRVGELSDVTAQEVAESRKAYKGAYDALAPFKRLLDVWISEYFGNKGAKHTTRVYAGAIVANNYSKANEQDREAIEAALALAAAKRFFHWELEFPEVFYGETKRKENGGFDAVVGNPPYVRVQRLSHQDTDYLFQNYLSCARKIDISLAFLELGSQIIAKHGYAGFISSSQWLSTDYGISAREFMGQGRIARIIDFGSLHVFEEASTYPAIFILTGTLSREVEYLKVTRANDLSLSFLNFGIYRKYPYMKLGKASWSFGEFDLRERLSSSLFELASNFGHFYIGALTGLDEVFVVTAMQSEQLRLEKGLLLPYAYRGEEIEQYAIVQPAAWAIYPYEDDSGGESDLLPEDELREKYPRIYNHLLNYRNILEQRQDSRRYYAIGDEWFRYLRPGRFDYIYPEKLVIKGVATRAEVGILEKHTLFNGANCPGFIIEENHLYSSRYLLAIFNSYLVTRYLIQVCPPKLQGYSRFNANNLNNIPIRCIAFATPASERTYYLEKAKNLYEYCLSKNDQLCVTGFVEHHLSKEPEESDVVHDLLAFLAEEMIRLNKEKRAAQKEFLDWLVTTVKILPGKDGRKGIDALTGKSKLADYVGDYQKGESPLEFGELWDILLKNKGRLGVRLGDAGLMDQVRARYEGSLARALPIKERLARTDRLIDQVVYRLYGLTEEEIRVVEG